MQHVLCLSFCVLGIFAAPPESYIFPKLNAGLSAAKVEKAFGRVFEYFNRSFDHDMLAKHMSMSFSGRANLSDPNAATPLVARESYIPDGPHCDLAVPSPPTSIAHVGAFP